MTIEEKKYEIARYELLFKLLKEAHENEYIDDKDYKVQIDRLFERVRAM